MVAECILAFFHNYKEKNEIKITYKYITEFKCIYETYLLTDLIVNFIIKQKHCLKHFLLLLLGLNLKFEIDI